MAPETAQCAPGKPKFIQHPPEKPSAPEQSQGQQRGKDSPHFWGQARQGLCQSTDKH